MTRAAVILALDLCALLFFASGATAQMMSNKCDPAVGVLNPPGCGPWGFQLALGTIDVAGIVTGGTNACMCNAGFSCAYPPDGNSANATDTNGYAKRPAFSNDDNCFFHDDRDFELTFIPTSWAPANGCSVYSIDWSRNSVATGALGTNQDRQMSMEEEFEFFFPTIYHYEGGPILPGSVLKQGQYTYGGLWFNGWVPWSGDQIALRGLHVWDCDHSPNSTEIHPHLATAWMKKDTSRFINSINIPTWWLTFNAMSHYYRPATDYFGAGGVTLGSYGSFYSKFELIGYDPNRPLVGPIWSDNWLVNPLDSYVSPYGNVSLRTCNNSCWIGNNPYSNMAGGDPCHTQSENTYPVSQFFSYGATTSGTTVTLSLSSVAETENTAGLPVLGSATAFFCQPVTLAEACGGKVCGSASDGCVQSYNCGSCPAGQVCSSSGTACVTPPPPCGPSTCPDGCCLDGTCYPGTDDLACGSGGGSCRTCRCTCNSKTGICWGTSCIAGVCDRTACSEY